MVTIVCIILFSANYTSVGKPSPSPIIINDDVDFTNSRNVVLTITTSNVGWMRFSNDNGLTWTTWEDIVPSVAWTLAEGDGVRTVSVQFLDNPFATPSEVYSDTITLDTASPTLVIVSPVSGLWFNTSNVEVTGTASDIRSGVSKIEYQLDSTLGTWNLVAGTDTWDFTVSSLNVGSHTIYVRATDTAGNRITLPVAIKIDTVTPSSSVSSLSLYQSGNSFTVSYTSQDVNSGINNVHLWVKTPKSSSYADLGVWVPGSSYTATAGDGIYEFYTIAVDNAGNTEDAPSGADASTRVDSSPPTTTASPSGTLVPGETNWYNGTVQVTLSAVDDGSGVLQSYYKFDGASNYQVYTTPFPISAKGSTIIYYYSTDNGGNSETPKTTTINITYPITFTVSGLPMGTIWSATLDGTTKSSTESIIIHYAKTGTHTWSVINPLSGGTGIRYATSAPQDMIDPTLQTAVGISYETQYQVTFAVAPTLGGTTSPNGAIWVNAGGEVTANATAASSNYKFSLWTSTAGAISSSTSPSTTITITGSGTVTANFEQVQTQEPTPTANPTSNPTQGQNSTPRPTVKPTTVNPTPTPTVTVVPSNYVSKSILASTSDGSSTYLTIYGDIDDSELSNAVLTKDQNTGQTTLSLTLIGQSGTNSFCNLTVPKRVITQDTVPTVYINNQIVNNQGYRQDNDYVYVWYNTFLNTYDLSVVFSGKSDFPLWPIGIVIGVSIALVAGIVTPRLKSKGNPPLMAKNEFVVSDYVISDGILKFYNRQGLLENKRVPVREIPISTISNIEHFWNELTITWNDVIDTFRKKKNYESFNEEVTAKVQAIMDENKRALEKQEKIYLRNTNIETILNDSLPVVDVVFDVLRGLHAKRVDWATIEDTSAILGQSINLITQSLPALSLDFTQLSLAISKQDPREVANQSRVILKAILEYFNRLRLMDTVPDVHPNLDDVAMLVNSYYLLNDLMLGKLVNQKENPREIHSLERSLQKLSKDTKFKMDLEDLRARIGRLNAEESDTEDVIGDTRELFKDQILQLYSST